MHPPKKSAFFLAMPRLFRQNPPMNFQKLSLLSLVFLIFAGDAMAGPRARRRAAAARAAAAAAEAAAVAAHAAAVAAAAEAEAQASVAITGYFSHGSSVVTSNLFFDYEASLAQFGSLVTHGSTLSSSSQTTSTSSTPSSSSTSTGSSTSNATVVDNAIVSLMASGNLTLGGTATTSASAGLSIASTTTSVGDAAGLVKVGMGFPVTGGTSNLTDWLAVLNIASTGTANLNIGNGTTVNIPDLGVILTGGTLTLPTVNGSIAWDASALSAAGVVPIIGGPAPTGTVTTGTTGNN